MSIPSEPGRVVFDLDDVLCDLREHLASALNRHTGRALPWEAWTSYDLPALYGLEQAKVLSLFVEHEVLERAHPASGAKELLAHCRSLGYETRILTARGWHPEGDEVTRTWLADFGIVVDHLDIVELEESKATVIQRMGGALAYLDDNPRHILESVARKVVANPMVMDRPWNHHLENVPRIYHLDEVAGVLEKQRRAA